MEIYKNPNSKNADYNNTHTVISHLDECKLCHHFFMSSRYEREIHW
jgi:hypothetical protein